MRFATPQGFNTGDHFFSYLKDSFDALYAEGTKGEAKMMSIGLHCRLIGRPGRVIGLKRFIEYAQSHADVWFARRVDIAEHWRQTHPPVSLERPSQMNKARFVELYGSIFEHSPWIAEAAHDLELGPAHDSAVGVHNALTRVFRSASEEKRLEVLRAHPDLAGKLAQAARLTEASSHEQASAGLDALTDGERNEFESLNSAYVAKHGFPFIIAVRDHTKTEILNAFQSRIDNETATEIDTACKQVERIAELRLKDLF